MDQMPPQIDNRLSTHSVIDVQDIEKTILSTAQADEFLAKHGISSNESEKTLRNITNNVTIFKQDLINQKKQLTEELYSLHLKCKQLDDRIKILEKPEKEATEPIQIHNDKMSKFLQQIKDLQSDNTRLETNYKSLSFKTYIGGGIVALLFVYFWYIIHK